MFNLPNLLTLTNLACGCVAMKYWYDGDYQSAAILIFVALVADFLDGFAARLLKIAGDFGKQLDSLADVVTFGVFPGIVVYSLLEGTGWEYIALIVPLFSALRLAKFNIDTRQSESFRGLATPANGLFWLGWGYFTQAQHSLDLSASGQELAGILSNPVSVGVAALLTSLFLISDVPMFSLKFKSWGWKVNSIRYIFLLATVVVGALTFIGGWSLLSVTFVILLYLVFSIINNLVSNKK